MDDNSQHGRFQFRLIDLFALLLIVSILAASIKFSLRYLPPMSEMPPSLGEGHEGQNWIGQGGWGFAGYTFLLLGATYGLKRIILARCKRRLAAAELFAIIVVSSLPYLWFLCEADWFNPFFYRVTCWVGGPIMFWFVPVVSFLVDLRTCRKPKALTRYLIRSAVEVVIAFPLWAYLWTMFSFWILGWGWI